MNKTSAKKILLDCEDFSLQKDGAYRQFVFLDSARYRWLHRVDGEIDVFIKGFFHINERLFQGESALNKLAEVLLPLLIPSETSLSSIKKLLLAFRGQFSFIIRTSDLCLAVVDRLRSHQVTYHVGSQMLTLSNDAHLLQKTLCLYDLDTESVLEFAMSSYVSGRNRTLFKDIQQLEPGEFLLAMNNKQNGSFKVYLERYYAYSPDSFLQGTESKFVEKLYDATHDAFKDIVNTCYGRPIFLSLSAGLDSRVVAAMLKRLGCSEVTCFSFGKTGNYEAHHARKIADHLGYKWVFLPTTKRDNRRFYFSEIKKNYSDYADGLSSLPSLLNFFAICQLREKNLIPDDAVFMNGCSGDFTAGKHIPPEFYKLQSISCDRLIENIIKKHFNLWESLCDEKSKMIINKSIQSHLNLPDRPLSPQEAASLYEQWEWQGRQCKYALNGNRVYEFWNYDGRLPLWHERLMDFWSNVPFLWKDDEKLYISFLKKYNFFNLFSKDLKPKNFLQSRSGMRTLPEKSIYYLLRPFLRKNVWQSGIDRFITYVTHNLQYASLFPLREVLFCKNRTHDAGNSFRTSYHLSHHYSIKEPANPEYILSL